LYQEHCRKDVGSRASFVLFEASCESGCCTQVSSIHVLSKMHQLSIKTALMNTSTQHHHVCKYLSNTEYPSILWNMETIPQISHLFQNEIAGDLQEGFVSCSQKFWETIQ
jgi:hypothetical protein